MFIVQLVVEILALKRSLLTVATLNLWFCANVSDTHLPNQRAKGSWEANVSFDEFATHHEQYQQQQQQQQQKWIAFGNKC